MIALHGRSSAKLILAAHLDSFFLCFMGEVEPERRKYQHSLLPIFGKIVAADFLRFGDTIMLRKMQKVLDKSPITYKGLRCH